MIYSWSKEMSHLYPCLLQLANLCRKQPQQGNRFQSIDMEMGCYGGRHVLHTLSIFTLELGKDLPFPMGKSLLGS